MKETTSLRNWGAGAVYVAAPYTSDSAATRSARVREVDRYCARLFRDGGFTVISPLTMGHNWTKAMPELADEYEMWMGWCLSLLSKCREIHVLMLPGWRESVGVTRELEFAKANGIIISFVKNNWHDQKSK